MSNKIYEFETLRISTFCGPEYIKTGYGPEGRTLAQVDIGGRHMTFDKEAAKKLIKVLRKLK